MTNNLFTFLVLFNYSTSKPAGEAPFQYEALWNGSNVIKVGIYSPLVISNAPAGLNTIQLRAIDPNRYDALSTSAWSQVVSTNIPALVKPLEAGDRTKVAGDRKK